MKQANLLKIALILFAFALPISIDAQQEVSLKKSTTAQRWIDNFFAKGKLPPFSFTYGDENSEKFIRKWNFSKKRVASNDANVIKYEVTYSEPGASGIEVKCDVTGFSKFEAVEWTLHFTNKGDKNSKKIKNVSASDILFSTKNGNSSMFSTSAIEVMKRAYLGANGHLAVHTNAMIPAIHELEKRGYRIDMTTAKYKGGKMIAVYLEKEFGGFAVHLVLNK